MNCLIIQWSGHSLNNICRAWRMRIKMYTTKKKIQKDKGVESAEFEDTVARAGKNFVAAAAAAPSVPAFRAPTASTPSGSDMHHMAACLSNTHMNYNLNRAQ